MSLAGISSMIRSLSSTVKRKWNKLSYHDLLSYTVLKPLDMIISQLFFAAACAIVRFSDRLPHWLLQSSLIIKILLWLSLITPEMATEWSDPANKTTRLTQKVHDTEDSFSILSHNIWYHFVAGGMWRRSRLLLFIQRIREDRPSIIALQEMFIGNLGFVLLNFELDYLGLAMKYLGYHYRTHLPFSKKNQENGSKVGSTNHGCVLFSLFPITEETVHSFTVSREYCLKGFQSCRVKFPRKIGGVSSIRIWNVHLEHLDGQMKRSQIDELTKSINDVWQSLKKNKQEQQCTGLLCTGDFNICSNDTFGEGLYKNLLVPSMNKCGLIKDLFSETPRTFRILPTGNRETTGSYDHMFINDTLSKQLNSECTILDWKDNQGLILSDHYGIRVCFTASE